jgi:hypothetical protein
LGWAGWARALAPTGDCDEGDDEEERDDQRSDEDREHGASRVARLTHRANVMFASCIGRWPDAASI